MWARGSGSPSSKIGGMGGKLASGALSAPAPPKAGPGAGAAASGGVGGSEGGVVAAAGPVRRRRVGARAGPVLGRTATAFGAFVARGFLAEVGWVGPFFGVRGRAALRAGEVGAFGGVGVRRRR